MQHQSANLPGGVCALRVALMVTAALLSGCGGRLTQDEKARVNLLRVAQFYRQYVESHGGKEPLSADELRKWVVATNAAGPEGSSDTDLGAVFVSLRDGQPYVVVPAGKGGVTQQGDRIVVYEQKGVGGKRMVAYDSTRVTEIDEMLFVHLQEEHL